MGLLLAGISCVRKDDWAWAGIFLGLAFMAQQFAVLAIAPLLVLVPRHRITRFIAAMVASILAMVVPLTVSASTKTISVAMVGSGDSSVANTLLGVLHPQAPLVLLLSRFAPIVLAMLTARWASKRIGSGVLEPVPLIALMATCLCYRLIFEVNLWGYYFMAVGVSLIILDVLRGRIQVVLLAWLALVVVAFYPTSSPAGVFQTAVPLWLPLWLWQLVLVPIAITLAARPLVSMASERRHHLCGAEVPVTAWTEGQFLLDQV